MTNCEQVDILSGMTDLNEGVDCWNENKDADATDDDNNTNHPASTSHQKVIKIEERLNKAIESIGVDVRRNRSSDLIPLTADFVQMKQKLRSLIVVINTYQKRTRDLNESRFEIAENLSRLSELTPICEEISCELDGEATEELEKIAIKPSPPPPSSSPSPIAALSSLLTSSPTSTISYSSIQCECSFSTMSEISFNQITSDGAGGEVGSLLKKSVCQIVAEYRERSGADILSLYGLYSVGAAQAVANDQQYQRHVVDFVTEWERIVTERIESGLKRIRKLASDRRHYVRKIETLRNRANSIELKGKARPAAAVARLCRNEVKLKQAFAVHENEAGRLCAVMEAVTKDGYKDLYTLVKNYIEWEINRIRRESDIFVQMNATLDSMNNKCKEKEH